VLCDHHRLINGQTPAETFSTAVLTTRSVVHHGHVGAQPVSFFLRACPLCLARGANPAHQALVDHGNQVFRHRFSIHTQQSQPGHDAENAAHVQRGQDQVAGGSCVQCSSCCFCNATLPDQNDVQVVAQKTPHFTGEVVACPPVDF